MNSSMAASIWLMLAAVVLTQLVLSRDRTLGTTIGRAGR